MLGKWNQYMCTVLLQLKVLTSSRAKVLGRPHLAVRVVERNTRALYNVARSHVYLFAVQRVQLVPCVDWCVSKALR